MIDYIWQYYFEIEPLLHEKVMQVIRNCSCYKYPMKLEIALTNACNQNCIHCSNFGPSHKTNQIDLETIDNLLKYESVQIVLTGGEPFLHPNIFEIINKIKINTGSFVKICSNGILLDKETCRQLKKTGIDKFDTLQISLDAATSQTYRKIRGIGFQSVIDNISNIKQYIDCTLEIHYVPILDNFRELHDIMKIALDAKADIFSASPLANLGNADNLQEVPTEILVEQEYYIIQQLKDTPTYYQGKLFEWSMVADKISLYKYNKKTPTIYKCGAGTETLYINSDKKVYPCVYLKHDDFNLGILGKNNFGDIIVKGKNLFGNGFSYDKSSCEHCKLLGVCNGGCIGIAYQKNGKFVPGMDGRCALQKSSSVLH